MPLTLTLASARGPASRERRTLTEGNLAIGRSPDNGWVLPDPDRLLSKTHCFITLVKGRYVLTDVSTNGVFVNGSGTRVPRDGQVTLTDGDEFRLGDYVFSVEETAAPATAAPPPAEFGARADPLDALQGDPLDGPFGNVTPGFEHPLTAPAQPGWRDDDPFDAGKAPGHDPFAFDDEPLLQPAKPDAGWQGHSHADHAEAPSQSFTPPRAVMPPSLDDIDFDDLLGDIAPGQPVPPPAPVVTAAPPPAAPVVAPPPAPTPVPAPVAAPVAVPVQATPPVDAARLLAAFLEGAGVAGLAVGQEPEAAMRAAGEVFRAMVEGVRQVLISRAAIKNEFRVEQTMLRARDNNALKFSVTTDDAVAALLAAGRPGYQAPTAAAREAFNDISSHEMAVMAGVQTALMALLKRFEPATLEGRLVDKGLLGNIMPAARKARTWELFCATYGEIVREAEDDFQSVFGREFARAYDAQMRKL
jgi:type VI secretion system FHA domain protein